MTIQMIKNGRCVIMTGFTKSRAFTLIELLVVVGVVAVLLAILLPILLAAKERGRRTACLSNVHQLGAALLMYAQDTDGFFPVGGEDGVNKNSQWDDALLTYTRNVEAFHCPSCPIPALFESSAPGTPHIVAKGYALNFEISGAATGPRSATSEVTVPFPSTTVAFCEVSFRSGPGTGDVGRITATGTPDMANGLDPGVKSFGTPGALRHQGGSDYGFADGHAHWYLPEQVAPSGYRVNGVLQLNNGSSPTFDR